jgi:hypothetical protein
MFSFEFLVFSFELIFNKYSTILKGCDDYRIINVEYKKNPEGMARL